jgi:hypothetical protein
MDLFLSLFSYLQNLMFCFDLLKRIIKIYNNRKNHILGFETFLLKFFQR